MDTKYISKNKENKLWKISTTKTGKAIRYFKTQVEAIEFAKTFKNIEKISIKKSSGWVETNVRSKVKKNIPKKTSIDKETPQAQKLENEIDKISPPKTASLKIKKTIRENIEKAELIKSENSLSKPESITIKKNDIKNIKKDIQVKDIEFIKPMGSVSRKTALFLPLIGISIMLITIGLLIGIPILWKL